jgi:hypothetical protein
VDNGHPWGGFNDLPPALALWVLGLHVALHWNDPCAPEQNGVVERTQGVSAGWVESQTCADAAELQRRLDENDYIQRARYPSIAGRSRWEAYPGLRHSGRTYSRRWEQRAWSRAKVLAYLATRVVPRKVDRCGKVSLYRWGYGIGRRYAGQTVWARLEAESRTWVITDQEGAECARLPASELTRKNIVNLSVARHRPARNK